MSTELTFRVPVEKRSLAQAPGMVKKSAKQTSVQHAANVSFQPIYTFTLFYVSKHTLP